MGRYYSGDIEGKFWFGIQSSDAASRFGGEEFQPEYIEYYFNEDHLDEINQEIKNIEEKLGDKVQKLNDFFAGVMSYNDKDLKDLGITQNDLSDYADLGLGIKIRDCVVAGGSCQFTAEL